MNPSGPFCGYSSLKIVAHCVCALAVITLTGLDQVLPMAVDGPTTRWPNSSFQTERETVSRGCLDAHQRMTPLIYVKPAAERRSLIPTAAAAVVRDRGLSIHCAIDAASLLIADQSLTIIDAVAEHLSVYMKCFRERDVGTLPLWSLRLTCQRCQVRLPKPALVDGKLGIDGR